MSNEPVRKVASFDESVVLPAPGVPAAPSCVGLAADAEIALAALRRIEAALAADRAAPPMARLRRHLAETADDIAEARLALALDHEYGARTLDMNALLARLESRLAAMLTIAGVHPAAAAEAPATDATAAEPEQVPTVSGVVSLLGGVEAARTEEPGSAPEVANDDPAPAKGPSFAMLEAMVQALSTSGEPPAAANREPPTQEIAEPAPAEPEPAATLSIEPESIGPQPVEARMDAIVPPLTAVADIPIPPESDLLSSFARMETMAFLPPEIGTAVIFERAEPAPAAPQEPDAPEAAAPPETAAEGLADIADTELLSASDETVAAPEPAAPPESAPPAALPPLPDPLAPLRARSETEIVALFS